ncbi:helix-turn-helix domain-containing protein [Bacillus alkalicellulosilyticus]|uniref:helix-turn-helix domain-containing protein n=1 Tax=Alkalihalobacterium alkalicellulosilyticum TaxID=1912214 RepID=UPI0009969F71|nr:helix-turn-helix transcriptional regulator [Bacillus alkalicellulosilyticus]
MENPNVGRKIRAFRKLKGYTQESFAKTAGVSVSLLGEIERGSRMPNEEFVVKVASLLKVDISELEDK